MMQTPRTLIRLMLIVFYCRPAVDDTRLVEETSRGRSYVMNNHMSYILPAYLFKRKTKFHQLGNPLIRQGRFFTPLVLLVKPPHPACPRAQIRILLLWITMTFRLLVSDQLLKDCLPVVLTTVEHRATPGVPIKTNVAKEFDTFLVYRDLLPLVVPPLVLALHMHPASERILYTVGSGWVAVPVLLLELHNLPENFEKSEDLMLVGDKRMGLARL